MNTKTNKIVNSGFIYLNTGKVRFDNSMGNDRCYFDKDYHGLFVRPKIINSIRKNLSKGLNYTTVVISGEAGVVYVSDSPEEILEKIAEVKNAS